MWRVPEYAIESVLLSIDPFMISPRGPSDQVSDPSDRCSVVSRSLHTAGLESLTAFVGQGLPKRPHA